jgi:hypothetical protein
VLTSTSFILRIMVYKRSWSSAPLSAPALYPINQGEAELWIIRRQEVLGSTACKCIQASNALPSRRSVVEASSEACNCAMSGTEERKQRITYWTASTSSSPGKPRRLNPAIPYTVCQMSTMSPGLSAKPPNSESYEESLACDQEHKSEKPT